MANKLITHFWPIAFGLLIASCGSKSFDSSEELWAYLSDTENGYHQEKEVNGIRCALTYKPTDLLVAQELGEGYTATDVQKLRKKYGEYLYFNLSLSANGQEILNQKVGNRAEFGAMVNQLAFGMGEKVNLISQGKDTIPLLDYVYPRMYGMGQSTDMLLVYKREKKAKAQDYLRFTLEDLGFGTGEIAFNLDTKKIQQQPRLNF